MNPWFTPTSPPPTVTVVRRPLSDSELDIVRARIHEDAAGPYELVDAVVTAVFDALLTDQGVTYRDHRDDALFDRNNYAIPVTQWTAIVTTVTDRAYTWGAAASAGMNLAALLPASYDDPAVPTPLLTLVDTQPHLVRLDISRDATATVAACQQHLVDLADAYGTDSDLYRVAAASWSLQLTALISAPPGAHRVLHPDGPLSLYVSTDDAGHYGIVFDPLAPHCTVEGCHAVAADGQWQPSHRDATVIDHEHQPSHPADGPQPGRWEARP
ncbi:hypothetical protein ACGFJ7_35215 [Actinoplanes sp. NPDC048988]|uniref:hypothetical protein n=1 Tax=Actinoplanes sp. NPDC048988 TaxID=3363901 RepID=UPI00371F9501